MKIIVLGGGLVGNVIAKDLAEDKDFQVTVADIDGKKLNRLAGEAKIKGVVADLSNSEVIKKIVADQDMVVGAVPGFVGDIFGPVIEAGKNIVDISLMPENKLTFDKLAKKNGVTAVFDMGVAPGISNMIVGYVDSLLDESKSILILVGGIPVIREWPYEYKVTWSPTDTIKEYLIPARSIECGKIIEKPALSDLELINLPGVGTLEAFNTDGLRSLLHTIKATFMKEKTLRYPGYADKIRMLRKTGFFSDNPIEVKGVRVKPIDFTSKLLLPIWKLKEGESDLTVMKIVIEGKKHQRKLRYTYDFLDYFDEKAKISSMARTTGFPCAIMARLVAWGDYSHQGVSPPEYIGREHKIYHKLRKELERRGIFYKENATEVE